MLKDALLTYVTTGGALSLVGATGASFSTTILDLLGQGVGTAPVNIIGNATTFGMDLGVGAHVLELYCTIGTTLTTSDSCTLNAQWQFAQDSGTPNYTPSTWWTVVETGPIAVANLTANTRILAVKWPQMFPFADQPRFHRLNFVTPTGEQFTAGTIGNAFLTDVPDSYSQQYQARNYTVK